jgi:hypothetical protein
MIATMSTERERPATGHDRAYWFARLDEWGAAGRPYREIADWLTGEQGLSAWWAQKIIVEYEQVRGVREPGVRRDGTFSVGASKTISVPADRAFEAFVDTELRSRWLPGVAAEVRSTQPGRRASLGFDDGTRLNVQLEPKGPDRVSVAVEHQRLPDAGRAAAAKARLQERLDALKSLLEDGSADGPAG